MSGVSSDKLTSTDSATAPRRHSFDWSHALVELATVVVGILIALAINNISSICERAGPGFPIANDLQKGESI